MSQLNAQKQKIITETSIPRGFMEAGCIVTFKYKTTTGENNKTKLYFALILHPNYKKYVHAISLENVRVQDFEKLAKKVGVDIVETAMKYKRLQISALDFEKKAASKIYLKEIKNNRKLVGSYRKFHLKEMKMIRLVDYDFTFITDVKPEATEED